MELQRKTNYLVRFAFGDNSEYTASVDSITMPEVMTETSTYKNQRLGMMVGHGNMSYSTSTFILPMWFGGDVGANQTAGLLNKLYEVVDSDTPYVDISVHNIEHTNSIKDNQNYTTIMEGCVLQSIKVDDLGTETEENAKINIVVQPRLVHKLQGTEME